MRERPQRSMYSERNEFIWRALLELAGLFVFALVILLLWSHYFSPKWEDIWEGLFIVFILELIVVGITFLLKEPALERLAKSLFNRSVEWEQIEEDEPSPAVDGQTILPVTTVNKMQDTYSAAVKILEATLLAKEKEVDGETITKKLFSWDMCYSAGLVDRWDKWNVIMQLWEEAGVAKDTRKRKSILLVKSVAEGVAKLDNLMVARGWCKLNGIWMRS